MSRADRVALLISLTAIVAAYLVHDRVFERMAHIEDEMAYVWEAQAVARGRVTLPSPPGQNSFLIPFVVDYHGQRFGKYPLGWPIVLAFGERLGIRYLINPLLAGFGLWLTYRLGKKLLGETVGLLAGGLTLTSPFFLMNSGSLLSHPLGLVLTEGFALCWLETFVEVEGEEWYRWLAALSAGGALGVLALTRPFTAVAVGLPFALHGIYLLAHGGWKTRMRLIALALVALAISSLILIWQYAVSGEAFLNPYTLWWSYDQVGFGPGHGRISGGHNLSQAWINTRFSLYVGYSDLFGWLRYSWIFLPFGLWAILRTKGGLLVASIFPSLLVLYLAYWIGSWLLGPRYYYEGLVSLTLTSAAGIAWLAGWPISPGKPFPNYNNWRKYKALGVTALLAFIVSMNLLFYTPMRLESLVGLYGVQRVHTEPFRSPSAQQYAPALIIVHPAHKWIEYGTLLDLENPFLDTPFIFIISRGPEIDAQVAAAFPERAVYHYYPNNPYTLYTSVKADSSQ